MTIWCCLLVMGCVATHPDPADPRPGSWDGTVEVHGALRAMFHEGRTGAEVSLDELLPAPDLYAVGAVAELAGEITILDGEAFLSYPAPQGARTERSTQPSAGACLLVVAAVPHWHTIRTDRPIPFEELDDEIAQLGASAGLPLDRRFPFLVEGEVEDLRIHVIDGRRLTGGGSSHRDHLEASVRIERDRGTATLLGFYSQSDQGVFTHIGSRTHIHAVLPEPLTTGHVDHVHLPAGTTLKLPVGAGPTREPS